VGTNPFLWHEVSDVNQGEVYMETNFKLMLASLAGVVIAPRASKCYPRKV
jgi:hypothetical protein